MAFASDDSSFIIRLRHQSVFGIGRDWTLNLLYNYQRLYQLSWLETTVKLNLFNYVLTLFRVKFDCNLAFRNLVFRWE